VSAYEYLPSSRLLSAFRSPVLLEMPSSSRSLVDNYRLGSVGLNPKKATVNLIGFDHSGSVVATGGADPLGNRFNEARRAVDAVARAANRKTLVGVLHFDQPSSADVPPTVVADRQGLARVRQSLGVPRDARGSSDLGPLMSKATRIAKQFPEHDLFLTLFTDFEITDADPGQVFDQIAQFPGIVHAISLNRRAPLDLRAPNIIITEVMFGDPSGSVAAALHASLTATRPGRRDGSVLINTRPSVPPLSLDGVESIGTGR
jgi:hypothetical protein